MRGAGDQGGAEAFMAASMVEVCMAALAVTVSMDRRAVAAFHMDSVLAGLLLAAGVTVFPSRNGSSSLAVLVDRRRWERQGPRQGCFLDNPLYFVHRSSAWCMDESSRGKPNSLSTCSKLMVFLPSRRGTLVPSYRARKSVTSGSESHSF